MKKRVCNLLLWLVLCLALLPTAAMAAWGTVDPSLPLYVCGQAVNSTGAVTGAGITGGVSYDAANEVLTLDGATLTYDPGTTTGIAGVIYARRKVYPDRTAGWTIDLKGENTITVTGHKMPDISAGLYSKYPLTITSTDGTGSLTIRFEGKKTTDYACICRGIEAGNKLTIARGVTVTVYGPDVEATDFNTAYSQCVSSSGDLTVDGTLNTYYGTAHSDSYGADCTGIMLDSSTLIVNGTVNVNCNESTTGSISTGQSASVCGIASSFGSVHVADGGTLTVDNSTATCTGSWSASSTGIFTYDDLIVDRGGKLSVHSGSATATGSEGFASSEGMRIGGMLTVKGELEAHAGAATSEQGNAESIGVGASTLCVQNGAVTATGGKADGVTASSKGIYNRTSFSTITEVLTIENSTVTATGGSASGSTSAESFGIAIDGTGSTMAIESGNVTATGGTATARTGAVQPTLVSGGLQSSDSCVVSVKAGISEFAGANYGISAGTLSVGEGEADVTIHAAATAAGGKAIDVPLNGELTRGEGVAIVTPKNGTIGTVDGTDSYRTVLDKDGKVAAEALLQRPEPDEPEPPKPPESPETPAYDSVPAADQYPVEVEGSTRGETKSNHKSAAAGTTVTITVTPGVGYRADAPKVVDKDGKAVSLNALGEGRYTFTMPASKVLVTTSFAPTKVFEDVPEGSWYYDAVNWAVGSGIATGVSGSRFGSDQPCTRAQMATFLWRAAGCPVVEYEVPFTDVKDNAYYTQAVRWASSHNIVIGYPDGSFKPDRIITREQATAILYRYANYVGLDTSQGGMAVREFADFELISDYAVPAMQWGVNTGMVRGANGKLNPRGNCTRAQVVTMIYRLLAQR